MRDFRTPQVEAKIKKLMMSILEEIVDEEMAHSRMHKVWVAAFENPNWVPEVLFERIKANMTVTPPFGQDVVRVSAAIYEFVNVPEFPLTKEEKEHFNLARTRFNLVRAARARFNLARARSGKVKSQEL